MIVGVKPAALSESHWYEYLIRFVLGGLATVLAGAVASLFGPATGGLFLAFPAIFCASATLIERHERARKSKQGLRGERRGREAAALDAAGTAIGSFGLLAFGIVIWSVAPRSEPAAFAAASIAWIVIAVALWWAHRRRFWTRRTSSP
jgi:hypothetical protein